MTPMPTQVPYDGAGPPSATASSAAAGAAAPAHSPAAPGPVRPSPTNHRTNATAVAIAPR